MEVSLLEHLRPLLGTREAIEFGDEIRDQPVGAMITVVGEVRADQSLDMGLLIPVRRGGLRRLPLLPLGICRLPCGLLAEPVEADPGMRIEECEPFDEGPESLGEAVPVRQ